MTDPAVRNGHTWEAPPEEALLVPDDVRKRMHWLFSRAGGSPEITGYCERWSKEDGATRLTYALVDTSERAGGDVLTKRFTLRYELYLLDVPLIIRPVEVIAETP